MSENEDREPDSSEELLDDTAEFGVGNSHIHEELKTDGAVIGGPGMVRTGRDRAVSTGTGGLAAGEDLDPVAEGDYWRENFRRRPYYEAEKEYSDYEPSYRYGWERAGQSEYRNRGFQEVELDLKRDWEAANAEGLAGWDQARDPALDAFERARGGAGSSDDTDRKDDDSKR